MNKRKLIEWGKSLLIVLLALSALHLTGMIGLLDFFEGNVSVSSSAEGDIAVETRSDMAARPLVTVITSADNAHHGVKYDMEALTEVHSWLSAVVGEALGSSGNPVEVSVHKWEDALYGQGVYFDFIYDQSISTMARWLGVEISSDISLHTARRFCLAVEGNNVGLYYIRTADGKTYRCDTALNASRLLQRLEGYMPNGAQFAFEADGEYKKIDPYYCVLSSLSEVSELEGMNPFQSSDGAELLEKFGMNKLVANHYPEEDGTHVYVEDEKVLRLSSDGKVLYSSMLGENVSELSISTPDAISKAYSIAMNMPGDDSWTLQMSGVSYDGLTGEYTVCFDYLANGVVICFGGRSSAMEIVIDGSGQLRRADMMCRSYAVSGSSVPMPERQALAVVSSLGGGEPMLCYADGGESVELKWVIKN